MLNQFVARTLSVSSAIIIALALGVACGGSKGDEPAGSGSSGGDASGKTVHISSMRLFMAYEKDKAAADGKYKGKTLKVTGLVEKKGEWLNEPYLALIGSGKKGAMFGYVRCFAAPDKIASINPGRVVTVVGLNKGKRVDVELRNCRVIK